VDGSRSGFEHVYIHHITCFTIELNINDYKLILKHGDMFITKYMEGFIITSTVYIYTLKLYCSHVHIEPFLI